LKASKAHDTPEDVPVFETETVLLVLRVIPEAILSQSNICMIRIILRIKTPPAIWDAREKTKHGPVMHVYEISHIGVSITQFIPLHN